MTPKIIMVPFSGRDSEMGALEAAAELAARWNAHMEVWHIAPNPHSTAVALYSIYGMGLTYIPDSLLVEIEKKGKDALLKAQKKFYRFLRIMQIAEDHNGGAGDRPSASFHLANGRADAILRIQARLCDLVVISRGYTDALTTSDNIVTDIAFHGGKPVLLMPAGKSSKPFTGKTMIAWNGSLPASRAVTAAMPFLQTGKVLIATSAEKAGKFPISAYELASYLERHGIRAQTAVSRDRDVKPAVSLLKKARQYGADMIVLGAYSHLRAREFILGGVTDHMLKKAGLPLFIVH